MKNYFIKGIDLITLLVVVLVLIISVFSFIYLENECSVVIWGISSFFSLAFVLVPNQNRTKRGVYSSLFIVTTTVFTFLTLWINFNFISDIKDLLNNLLIGIYASILLIISERFLRVCRLYKTLKPITGRWYEYCKKKNENEQEEKKFTFTGIASISYRDENELQIILETVKDAPLYTGGVSYSVHDKWEGIIQINEQQLSSGKISYSYANTFPKVFSYGFKEFSYKPDAENDSFIMLTEIALPGSNGFDYSLLKRKFDRT